MNEYNRITTLPRAVVERIAAGEVIERPASVVRELIENALDAHASTIRVELRAGGLRLIRVHDNGDGIAPDDLPLACLPHTTSKVHELADLERIRTLGFRGEALASIAAVANLEIASAHDSSGVAQVHMRRADGTTQTATQARSRGTTVTVRALFQSMPARLALLGAPRNELARCQALLRGYALAYPGVAFTLIHDGQLTLHTPGTNITDAVSSLYGADVARALLPFETTLADGTKISGVVSARGFHQAGREDVWVLVNGRAVANRTLTAAVESSYRSLLPKGRHPLLVASVTLPPERLDVNIHPAKTDVLLRDEAGVAAALRTAVHDALGTSAASIVTPALQPALRPVQIPLSVPRKRRGLRLNEKPARYGGHAIEPEDAPIVGPLPALEPLAQFDDALILARSTVGDLFLVDQHRAHERVLYERLLKQRAALLEEDGMLPLDADEVHSAGQLLLEPLLVELTAAQAALLVPRLTELSALGLACQPFGGSVFLVRSVPYLPGAAQAPADLARTLTETAAWEGEDWMARVSTALACRSAIRRGQPLAASEQRSLLADFQQVTTPAVCPHGSPIVLRYGRNYLTRLFEW
jgi:DNA mismatch repair protein MutL